MGEVYGIFEFGFKVRINREWLSETFLHGEAGLARRTGRGERGGRLAGRLNRRANSCIFSIYTKHNHIIILTNILTVMRTH